jgi:outer membrane protein
MTTVRRLTSPRVFAAVLMTLALAVPPGVDAQTTGAPPPSSEVLLRLTRDDAVRLAVENNPELAVVRFEPAVADARVAAARAVYLPTLSSSLLRNSESAPAANLFGAGDANETAFWSGSAGLSQLLPRGGGSYDLSYTTARTTTNNPFTSFVPSLTSSIQGVISQPLLRNFKIDAARAQLDLSRRNRDIADVQVRQQRAQVEFDAEAAYWALVSARAAVDVQQRTLDLALELERTNRARVEVGQSPPLDLVAARAEVAQRRESLIIARTQAVQAEDLLRTIALDPKRADYWTVRLEPADVTPVVAPLPDVDAAVRRALAERADVLTARKQVENVQTNMLLAENQTLPDVRAQATFLARGQGGERLLRTGGFPGMITGVEQTSFASVLGQVLTSDFPTWTVGFTVSYPLGRSVEEANLARAKIERDQAAARVRSLELEVVREVREAALRFEQNRQRIETTKLGRELAEQRLDAERKRFEVGMSTSFLVIQAQRDLAVARDNELRALLDYQLAAITFERVQQTSAR